MSPMYTRRTSHSSTASSNSSTSSIDTSMSEVVMLTSSTGATTQSPRKHMRSKQQHMMRSSLSFRETTHMEEEEDNDNEQEENHSNDCWYELKEDDEEEKRTDVISTTRPMGQSPPDPSRYHSVPNNTPIVTTTTTHWNNRTMYSTLHHNSSTATRLLFHDFDTNGPPVPVAAPTTRHPRSAGVVVVPPPRRNPHQFQTTTLRHPDENSHSSLGSVMSVSSTSVPSPPELGSSSSSPAPPLQGRKRNSIERRPSSSHPLSVVVSTPVTGRKLPCRNGGTKSMSFDEDDDDDRATATSQQLPSRTAIYNSTTVPPPSTSTYSSPKMSPNSYLTMDGRFVQSKNPFSSPMIVNHPYHGVTTHTTHDDGATTDLLAPSLPAFPMTTTTEWANEDHTNNNNSTTNDCTSPTQDRPTLQPKRSTTMEVVVVPPPPQGTPVSQATVGLQAFSFHSHPRTNGEGVSPSSFPSTASSLLFRSNNYVCSPIIESPHSHPLQQPDHSAHPVRLMMPTVTETMGDDELPTAGSLHKVRRIHRSDDIFAASHHHLSNLRHTIMLPQSGSTAPIIDTTTTTAMKLGPEEEEEDISPTDVMHFGPTQRFFAPTPVVPKHGPPPTPMKPPRASNVPLFSTKTNHAQQPPPPQNTPYPHHVSHPQHPPSPSRRNSTTTSPSSPVGLPPILTRKVLQPRTPLVTLNPIDRTNHMPSQPLPYWQKQHRNNTNSSGDDNQNEVWLSDNRCGYTDMSHGAVPPSDSALYTIHSGPAWNAATLESQPPPPSTSRFYSDFDIIGELGNGSFGSVFKVLSRLDGCMYAIKAAKRQAKGVADRDRMLKEVYALAALSDQADTATFHIVRYHQAWMEDDRLYIQTELCSGTLSDEMNRTPPILNVARRYKLLREMLLALDFIHRHNMVHLDIKPENIFIKNDQYKLGDFGLVTKASSSQDVEEGDSRYMSMELLSGDNRSDLTKSDIFSLGITMYEICLGRQLPMNGEEWQDIRAGKLSPLPNTDHDMANIIQRMLDPNPMNRPTPASLLKHPQLLSDEEKALNAERTKVIHANIQLAAQQQQMHFGVPVPKRALTRANTWSGSSLPYL